MQTIPKLELDFNSIELSNEIHDVLRNIWSQGGLQQAGYGSYFQNRYAHFCGTMFAFSSSLGNALKESLVALKLPANSEVICPSWISVDHVQSIMSIGLTPVFAEINPYTLSLDYSDVSHKLSSQTRAVVLNYPFGFPADPCTYVELCKHHDMRLIEIVPSQIGSQVDDKFIGTFGDVGIFETHPNQKYSNKKDCLIVTDRTSVYEHFSKKGLHQFSQLDGILGMHFLGSFEKFAQKRKELAQRYHQCFTKILHLSVLYELANAKWVHQVYPIRMAHKLRDALMDELVFHQVQFYVPKAPAHLYSYIQNVMRPAQLLTTERLTREILYLPIDPNMTVEEQNRIIEIIFRFFQKSQVYM
ncbi:MAG: DegT/DnrJ/EryC1/StrS aminotransferase family protein [Bdellovibrionales bacterium]|nr:DegT/DnrJ/EryC1/StrS aminotransferase family protein [Bdellovibrionales bacterium]